MTTRVVAIVVGLAMAVLLGAAAVAVSAHAAPHKAVAKKLATAPRKYRAAALPKTAVSAVEQPGAVKRRGGDKKAAAKVAPATAAEAQPFTPMPEGERVGIQSDLTWIRLFEGIESGDVGARTVAAIKAFQRRNNAKETGVLTAEERGLLAAAAKGPEEAVGWELIEDLSTGAWLGLPEKIVPESSAWRFGSRWTSAQGQIRIETFRLNEAALPALFEDEKKTAHRRIEGSAFRRDSFIISGVQGLKNFLMRAEARGSELRGVTVLYDQATAGTMATVAVAVINTFQGFPDPNSGPLPSLRRTVEYGSAIVVSGGGVLVTSAETTDECQAVTVPGLGHAERVAADKSSGLALLRLYGARHLTPAKLADESRDSDVTLVGIADPLSQEGGNVVSRASASLAGQALDPVPKLGFAGAAAVDAQGRLLGMVELKAPVVAAAGSFGQQATLVPVTTIRAILRANGVANGESADHGGIEQSVVRVICVRN